MLEPYIIFFHIWCVVCAVLEARADYSFVNWCYYYFTPRVIPIGLELKLKTENVRESFVDVYIRHGLVSQRKLCWWSWPTFWRQQNLITLYIWNLKRYRKKIVGVHCSYWRMTSNGVISKIALRDSDLLFESDKNINISEIVGASTTTRTPRYDWGENGGT